jgi:hypothetical protein
MERRLIGWMDKHLHVRPNLGVLGETKPVKRFEDILMWLAEIGGARECKRRREHIATPAERMHVSEPRSIGHAQRRAGRSPISEASEGNQAIAEFMGKFKFDAMTAALVSSHRKVTQ